MDKLVALFKSRRFWIALAAFANVVADPLGLDAATMQQSVLLAGAWIVGDSINKTV